MKKKNSDNINSIVEKKSSSIVDTSINKITQERVNQEISTSQQKQTRNHSNKDVLAVIFLQILVLVLMALLTLQYGWLHNVPTPFSPLLGSQDIASFSVAIANYNFIGVSSPEDKPSIFAVVLEVAIWSLAGVLARSEYFLSQIIVRKKHFNFWETSSKLISDGSMGVAIAIVVVLFLRATEFLNLSLQDANVASVAAVSFILGFYHEDTRRLLGNFQKKISETANEKRENTE